MLRYSSMQHTEKKVIRTPPIQKNSHLAPWPNYRTNSLLGSSTFLPLRSVVKTRRRLKGAAAQAEFVWQNTAAENRKPPLSCINASCLFMAGAGKPPPPGNAALSPAMTHAPNSSHTQEVDVMEVVDVPLVVVVVVVAVVVVRLAQDLVLRPHRTRHAPPHG